MPYVLTPPGALILPGCRAVLLGQVATVEELGAFAPLEESSDEGSLFLARLELAEIPSDVALAELEQALADAGVERWPGYDFVVHAAPGEPAVYLAWQKGFAWLPVIIGIVAIGALPPLLGGLVWWLIPDSLKNLINSMVSLGMMALMLYLVSKMMPKPAPAKPRAKRVEAKPADKRIPEQSQSQAPRQLQEGKP